MDLKSIQPPLRFTTGTEHIWAALAAIPRTGWVQWGIPNPETVAEHILATRKLAVAWRRKIFLNDIEFSDLLAIIEVHDWPELVTGDLVIMGDEPNAPALRLDKRAQEKDAMLEICCDAAFGPEVLNLYEQYETNYSLPAQYAKQLDKMQAVILASEYQSLYDKPGLLAEFITYSRPYIKLDQLRFELDIIAANFNIR